jgi:hypothetical protein
VSLRNVEAKLKSLKKRYSDNIDNIWEIKANTITSNGRCADNSKVVHSHSYKYCEFNKDAAAATEDHLKQIRHILQEEVSMQSYSVESSRINVEFFLHQVLTLFPELENIPSTAPITGYIPDSPPGLLDPYTYQLRNCISVLFMFERMPQKDQQFSQSCRSWIQTMLNALLRVASLSDHLFIFNHIMRCPAGVSSWATHFFQPLSPLKYHETFRPSVVHGVHKWKLSTNRDDLSNPIIDNWITMLATLTQPIIGREEFVAQMGTAFNQNGNEHSWTFIEEENDVVVNEKNSVMLNESDYIAFLDQFPITDVFKCLLGITNTGMIDITLTVLLTN